MTGEPLTFVDTNVLVYAHDDTAGVKQTTAQAALFELWSNRSGTLSTQVLQEFYVTVTRKVRKPMPRPMARDLVSDYSRWPVQRISSDDVVTASELEESDKLSFWDALIVVAASRSGATRLLTEDLSHGTVITGVRIENPFT